MANDFISREAAIESINGTCDTCGGKGIFCGENDCSTGNHLAKLRTIPAADVRPVVRGQDVWNTVTDHHCEFKCSICGEEIREYWGEDFNFCPYCGADMREETDA